MGLDALLVLWHMGSLHPLETVLLALLAFGPFVVLGVVVHVVRRRQVELERAEAINGAGEAAGEDLSEVPPAT